MSERLLIRLQADDELTWLAQDARGRALSGANAGAPPAQALARAQRNVVIVPSEDVLLLETPRLPGSRAQFLKALPFALEDRLASPVEELHFAVPERLDSENVPVATVARATMRGWLDRLARDGIRPDAVYAETQLLPSTQDRGCVLIEGARALWRRAPAQAGVCDLAELPGWLELLDADAGFEVYDFRDAAPLRLPAVQYHAGQRDALGFFAAQLAGEPGLNLLQGEFAPAHRQAPARILWRNAGAAAAAALFLLFAYYGADCWRLARQSARLEAAARATLHEAFPEMDKVAGDPRALMQSALTSLHGGGESGGLLRLLGRIAPILGGTTRTTLTALEYHNMTLELGLRAPDVAALDLIQQQLAGLGLKVEVTAANAAAQGIDGRLRIAGGAP